MANTRSALLYASAAMAFSGIAFYCGTGLHPLWWLTWVAPIPVLLVATKIPRKSVFAMAFLAWFAGATNQWHFFRATLQVPVIIVVLFSALPGLVFALDVLAYRGFLRSGSNWRAALTFPSIWVLFEFITARHVWEHQL